VVSENDSIWHQPQPALDVLQALCLGNMGEWLDIRFESIGPRSLAASMPVDHRTQQPYGLLHGGASVVLAETIGSIASALVIDPEQFQCVGLEVNANHLRSAKAGRVIGECTPLHLGATTHVWDIRIRDEADRLLCISRLTVAVIRRKHQEIWRQR
jgi:1,4-dihydroxy-2-naphthoyl-CoA hydrolase